MSNENASSKIGNRGGGRKPFKIEFDLAKNISKFSPKFWAELDKMIAGSSEDVLSDKILKFIGEFYGQDSGEAKDLIEKLIETTTKSKQFAMQEFNKIQVKTIPQDLTSGGEKINNLVDLLLAINQHGSEEDKIHTGTV